MVDLTFIASFLVLSVLGLLVSSYLSWKHRQKKLVVCPLNHDCSKVTESKWSRVFYLRNETLGMAFYVLLIVGVAVATTLPNTAKKIYLLMVVAEALALLFSLFLVYVQAKILNDYCFYCLISTVINLLLFINGLVLIN